VTAPYSRPYKAARFGRQGGSCSSARLELAGHEHPAEDVVSLALIQWRHQGVQASGHKVVASRLDFTRNYCSAVENDRTVLSEQKLAEATDLDATELNEATLLPPKCSRFFG
jgi:hypothetical protein